VAYGGAVLIDAAGRPLMDCAAESPQFVERFLLILCRFQFFQAKLKGLFNNTPLLGNRTTLPTRIPDTHILPMNHAPMFIWVIGR
jgi:hypothetical protein